MESGFILRTDADFDNAMFFALPVTVWQNGRVLDYGGQIERHTENAIYIHDGYFFKAMCDFVIR